MAVRVVWLKRDLRIDDHVPLRRSAGWTPRLALRVRARLWRRPEWTRPPSFVSESLDALTVSSAARRASRASHAGCAMS